MGIIGLLTQLKPHIKVCHISDVINDNNNRVAVDGYCWLHKAIYSSSIDYNTGQLLSNQWIKYCINMIDMLLSYKCDITIVFDGNNLPIKDKIESNRLCNRNNNLNKGIELYKQGDVVNSRQYLLRSIDINPNMVAELITILRSNRPNIKYIVAPYEADAQLAYLSTNNLIDVIITEDSDTIPYNCKQIIFKLNLTGSCEYLNTTDIYSNTNSNSSFDLSKFDSSMCLSMCIISGCDYLDSIKSIGIKSAYQLVNQYKTNEQILKVMRLKGLLPLTKAFKDSNCTDKQVDNVLEYELGYYLAYSTFQYQVVYDIETKQTRYLNPLDVTTLPAPLQYHINLSSNNIKYLGELFDQRIAEGIANGYIHPITKLPFILTQQIPIEITSKPPSNQNNQLVNKSKSTNSYNNVNRIDSYKSNNLYKYFNITKTINKTIDLIDKPIDQQSHSQLKSDTKSEGYDKQYYHKNKLNNQITNKLIKIKKSKYFHNNSQMKLSDETLEMSKDILTIDIDNVDNEASTSHVVYTLIDDSNDCISDLDSFKCKSSDIDSLTRFNYSIGNDDKKDIHNDRIIKSKSLPNVSNLSSNDTQTSMIYNYDIYSYINDSESENII